MRLSHSKMASVNTTPFLIPVARNDVQAVAFFNLDEDGPAAALEERAESTNVDKRSCSVKGNNLQGK